MLFDKICLKMIYLKDDIYLVLLRRMKYGLEVFCQLL